MDEVEIIVIGAGVVGLASAAALARAGREVLVLEAEEACGSVTSSRNSGIIHAGIYYAPGSLKARLCVEGRDRLYEYAAARGIAHKRTGKLIVATDAAQADELLKWKANAERNGVTGIRALSAGEAKTMESEVFCTAALHVTQTGIIDAHEYVQALESDVEAAGGMIALRTRVRGVAVEDGRFVLNLDGAAPERIACRRLVNAAGLGAQNVARGIAALDAATIPDQVLAKGNYFSLTGRQPFTMPIYPLPVPGSSGLHAFCDLGGRVRFGPDVEWVDHVDYTVDPARAASTADAVRRYWPGLPDGALQSDYCGVRPRLGRGTPGASDFVIQGRDAHGIDGLVCLYGIESPGLTASLAIGEHVAGMV